MPTEPLKIRTHVRSWPVAGKFTISRGSRTEAVVVEVHASMNGHTGRGECVPYARYRETVEGVVESIEAAGQKLSSPDNTMLQGLLPPGAARNGLDCALWDLRAKLEGRPAHELLGLATPKPAVTAYTISLDTPQGMGEKAAENSHRPLLKVKLGGDNDVQRIRAVHENAPDSKLIIDANEAWDDQEYSELSPILGSLGVVLIEQPFPAAKDDSLARLERPVPVCADESCHDRSDLPRLQGLYDVVNIKLDKTGGLTEGAALLREARKMGFGVMTGCMLGSSLAMAPALLLARDADFVDLDGPLLLKEDHAHGICYEENGTANPPIPALWG